MSQCPHIWSPLAALSTGAGALKRVRKSSLCAIPLCKGWAASARVGAEGSSEELTSELAAVGMVGGEPIGFITKLSF